MNDNVSDKKWCVYKHTSPSGKVYLGITSQKPEYRWQNGRGYNYNSHFYNAIQKYGWDNFQHEILVDNLSEKDAKDLEIKLIKEYNSRNQDFGYNLSDGGDGASGVDRHGELNSFYGKKHTEETKKKIATSNSMPVLQYDLDLNFLKEYPSAMEAARQTMIKQSQILGCCNKTNWYKTAGGYVWIFKKDKDLIDRNEYIKRLNHEKLPKPVCQFSLNMEFINEYKSIGEAGRMCDISYSDISNATSGRYQQTGGFIWVLSSDYQKMLNGEIPMRKPYKNTICRPIIQYSYDMEFINEYPSRVEAGKAMGVTPQAIGYACNSKSGKSSGYIWRYKELS